MRFGYKLCPVTEDCIFTEEGYFVWCGSMFRHGGAYYLAYSRWKRELGFGMAWCTDCEICLAKSDSMFGKFRYVKTIKTRDTLGRWDSDCVHNPTVLAHGGRFYLYYMGNHGDGRRFGDAATDAQRADIYWTHRNNQRVGVMWCDNPEGEWHFSDRPVIDVTPGSFDDLCVSNPTATVGRDGKILLVHKAVTAGGRLPQGSAVICGSAAADSPLGPFVKSGVPIMVNPETGWSVEDPFVWFNGERYLAIVKDFHGYFTKTDGSATALFESADGVDWRPADEPLAFLRAYPAADGMRQLFRMERPQLFFEDGEAKALLCACMAEKDARDVFNVRIPLEKA